MSNVISNDGNGVFEYINKHIGDNPASYKYNNITLDTIRKALSEFGCFDIEHPNCIIDKAVYKELLSFTNNK